MSAFDLNQLRTREGNLEAQQLLLDRQLKKSQLRCGCGKRIEHGVKLIATWTGTVNVPHPYHPEQALPQDAGTLVERAYCSRTCVTFVHDRVHGLPFTIELGRQPTEEMATDVIACVELPAVEWFNHPAGPAD